MRDKPLLSVVMPIHHGEAYLDATLASLPDSPDGLIEVIALDSTDGTGCQEIVMRHEGRWPLHYRHMPEVKSWTAKTNQAVAIARADHVAMLHQDDLWLPNRSDQLLAALKADPEVVMILTAAQIIDRRGVMLGRWRCPLEDRTLWDGEAVMERLLIQNFVALPSVVLRRDAWGVLGGLDESLWYTPDWDLYLKATTQGSVHYIAEATVAFRIHGESQTVLGSRDPADFLGQMETVAARYMDRIPQPQAASIRRLASASAHINTQLALAMHGKRRAAFRALGILAALSPSEIRSYFRNSRIVDRVLPRLRARLRGAL